MPLRRIISLTFAALVAAAAVVATSLADATPIGPLPKGPTTSVDTARGSLVAVALPRQNPSTGLVWRIARPLNTKVVKQVSEADVGPSVVLVFRVVGKGDATIAFGLTKGDSSGKAVRSATYKVHSR
jgi:hypothetical protein